MLLTALASTMAAVDELGLLNPNLGMLASTIL